ncbi:hypothetical protein [Desulfonatronospira sp.]|uniref:hypothetical protein n=1 Tax=Desulfonatronospira sp. TaxID=1962951 RepID=UPI0025C3EAF7|nr:hypothetical protein [Desulfonatronospira sp.]
MTRFLEARTITEAAAYISLQNPGGLCNWGPDRPLCMHCLQETATNSRYCPVCQSIPDYPDAGVNTGLLLTGKDLQLSGEPAQSISDSETVVLLPSYKVADFLLNFSKLQGAVVFPGTGDMFFSDATAIARYYSAAVTKPFIKLFFSHSHMRTLSLEDYLTPELFERLCSVAVLIKSAFNPEERILISGILHKDSTNQTYELSRFYSMCNTRQKNLLDRIQIQDIDPVRGLLLFQITRYVSQPD